MNDRIIEDAERFAEFVVTNFPDASKEWNDPVRQAAWYIGYGFAAAVCDQDGNIVALIAARPVERPGIGVLPYYFNEHGTCLHVDLLVDISPDKRALMALKQFCQIRFPQCTTIAMFRHFEEKIRVYSLNKFWKSFELIKRVPKQKKKVKRHEQTKPAGTCSA